MTMVRVWVDGNLVDSDQPAIRAVDHGVTVGDGAFETCKIVRSVPFALTRHLRRMDRTLSGLGLPAVDHDVVRAGIAAVLAEGEPIAFGRLRWTVTGGTGPLGSDRAGSAPTLIVTAAPAPPPPPSAAVVTVPWTRNERAATAGLKTTSYADNVVALARARAKGAMEAIFANTTGDLCEGTGSNVFVVLGGTVLTPPLESGCLAGVTRELLLEWARDAGIDIIEERLPLTILRSCAEIILTSTLKDVLPVHRVDKRELTPGPLGARLRQVWLDRESTSADP